MREAFRVSYYVLVTYARTKFRTISYLSLLKTVSRLQLEYESDRLVS